MAGDDGAILVIDRREEFGETYAHARAWRVPVSDRYPDGVKYSFQYGTKDETRTATDDGTIIRYDNFPDHPNAAIHHKHLPDGTVKAVDFTGLRPLFAAFKTEVIEDYDEDWN
ncbi:toxin-antitoxin system TumE family protein [Halonotius roseus]|uniref:Uncharacterized protein n=1 Tax=Halonotius roseus TaxID=2511997 RepID=A0A544QRZ2_9EURY|nr:DUF6516 family protein [Halonotius roseus]TQQ82224.1 hypothetical protein EWF95_04610 [Halonotius roseus]